MAKLKRNKAYFEWRDKVLERDKGCVICGRTGKMLNCHHLIPRNFKLFSLDIDNGIILCAHHHTLGMYSAHKHPFWFYKWMKQNRPDLLQASLTRMEVIENGV